MHEHLKQFAEMAINRPPQLRRLKDEGRTVVEYVGNFIPPELILASGAEAYLMCRGGEPEPPDAALQYMLRFLNPFAKSLAGYYLLGLDPVTPIADLLVIQQKDCHIARISELLEYLKLPVFKVGVPTDWKKDFAAEYYYESLQELKARLETLTGNTISDEALRAQVQYSNRINAALRRIDALRSGERPPLSGTEFIRLNHYSFYCEPGYAAAKLEELAGDLASQPGAADGRAPRVLLAGHIVAVGDYVVPELIERSGGVIVAEMLDEGQRDFRVDTEPGGDLLRALGERLYCRKTPPSLFQPAWKERFAAMERIIEEYRVDAVVWYQLSFDEIYDMEAACIARWLAEKKVPFLKLESSYEYSREHMGPLTTRVESFLEAVKAGK